MPIYEYQCQQCKERHEIIQRISDAPPAHCPKCGGEMKKLISSPAIQFKGSGFYKTDYAAGSKSETRNQKPEETKSEKSEGKSETSKPETTTKSET